MHHGLAHFQLRVQWRLELVDGPCSVCEAGSKLLRIDSSTEVLGVMEKLVCSFSRQL